MIAKSLHLLDKIITCEKPLDDADLLELDNRQIHKHSHTCPKKNYD